jgi:beta-catenin-like protein 1
VALDEAISAFYAAEPSHFPIMVSVKAHETLVGLLAHDNADIAASVLNVAAELLEDAAEEDEELLVEALAGELAEVGAVSAAISNWQRLQQEKESTGDAVQATAVFLERIHALDPDSAEQMIVTGNFLTLAVDTFVGLTGKEEPNEAMLAVSELLSVAAMSGTEALEKAGEKLPIQRIVESLLKVLNDLGRKKTCSTVGLEVLSNIANALANLISVPVWNSAYMELEGVQLQCKLLEKGGCGLVVAMRLLSYSTQENVEACEAVVEMGGLVSLFYWWSKSVWPKKISKRFGWGQDEWKSFRESLITVLYNCCSMLTHSSMPQLRLWKKFDDDNGAAVERLGGMWTEYRSLLARKGLMLEGVVEEAGDDEEEDLILLKRLDEGFLSMMQLTVMLVWLGCIPSPLRDSLQGHIKATAQNHAIKFGQIAGICHEHQKRTGYDLMKALKTMENLF